MGRTRSIHKILKTRKSRFIGSIKGFLATCKSHFLRGHWQGGLFIPVTKALPGWPVTKAQDWVPKNEATIS